MKRGRPPDRPAPRQLILEEGSDLNLNRHQASNYALQSIFTFGEGDVLELQGKIFAVAADYRDQDGEPSTRLLISYPDELRAAAGYRNLLDKLDPYLKIILKREQGFVFEDYRQKIGTVDINRSRLEIRLNLIARPSEPSPFCPQPVRKPAAVSGGTGLM